MSTSNKTKQILLTFGIIINFLILFMVGIFTLMCLVWPSSGDNRQLKIALVSICLMLLFTMISQIVVLSRLSNNKQNNVQTYDPSDNQIIDHERTSYTEHHAEFRANEIKSTALHSTKKENVKNAFIIIGGIVILYLLYRLGNSLDIL